MQAIQELDARLHDTDPGVRREACYELIGEHAIGLLPDLVALLGDEDPSVREAALDSLVSTGGSVVARSVVPLLRSESASLRNAAVEVLERLGADSLDALGEALGDEDDDVVKFAVDIISAISDERASGILCSLARHRNPNVRGSVAVCLGRLKDPSSVEYLLKLLSDPEQWVRFSAIEGLGYHGTSEALPELMRLVENEGPGMLKEAAIDALGKIATGRHAGQVLLGLEDQVRDKQIINVTAVTELLQNACSDPNGFRPSSQTRRVYMDFLSSVLGTGEVAEQLAAIKAIGLIGDHDSVGDIFAFAGSLKELDEEMMALVVDVISNLCVRERFPARLKSALLSAGAERSIALKAVAALRPPEAVPCLVSVFASASQADLRDIVEPLESIGTGESIKALKEVLKGPDGHARAHAARALGRLEGEFAVDDLFNALKNETYRDVLEEITDALSAIPSEGVRAGFRALLSCENEGLREMAARGLGSSGNEQTIEDLSRAAADAVPAVRKAAYKSLARLGVPEGLDVLASGLKDHDDDVRLSIVKALAGWSGEGVEGLVMATFKDPNLWVRYHCAMLLGELGGHKAETLLIDGLLSDEAPVRAACAASLERLGARSAIPALESLMDYPDDNVRTAVENAIGGLAC